MAAFIDQKEDLTISLLRNLIGRQEYSGTRSCSHQRIGSSSHQSAQGSLYLLLKVCGSSQYRIG